MNLNENKRSTLLEALKNTPDDPKLLVQLADVEFKLDCISEALEKYKQAAILGLDSIENKLNIVKCFYRLEKYKEAMVAAEQMIESGNDNAEFYNIICKVAIAQGNFYLAEEYYGYSVDMDDAFADGKLEKILKYKGQKQPTEEEHDFDDIDGDFDDIDLLENDVEEKGLFKEVDVESGFDCVDGLTELKQLLEFKVIQQDKNPELFKKFGQRKGGSILLYGPPGCGKEKMVKALSFESGRLLYSVETDEFKQFKSLEAKRFLDEVYHVAGINENCLLLFNNFNELFRIKKKDLSNEISGHFHSSIKKAKLKTTNIYTLATCVTPWELNYNNFQFDSIYFVPPPLFDERKKFLISQLESRPTSATSLNLEEVASKTIGFTYHDLKELVDKVSEHCLMKSLKSKSIEEISSDVLIEFANTMRPSSEEWLRLAKIHGEFGPYKKLLKDVFYYLENRD